MTCQKALRRGRVCGKAIMCQIRLEEQEGYPTIVISYECPQGHEIEAPTDFPHTEEDLMDLVNAQLDMVGYSGVEKGKSK